MSFKIIQFNMPNTCQYSMLGGVAYSDRLALPGKENFFASFIRCSDVLASSSACTSCYMFCIQMVLEEYKLVVALFAKYSALLQASIHFILNVNFLSTRLSKTTQSSYPSSLLFAQVTCSPDYYDYNYYYSDFRLSDATKCVGITPIAGNV